MNRRSISVVIIFVIFVSLSSCTIDNKAIKPLSKDGFMLGTFVVINLYDQKDEKIIDEVFERLREIENRMSVNIEDSDISLVNKNAGIKPVKVHQDVYYVLKKAKYYSEISGGAFEPTIGPLVNLWGIGTGNERVPSEEEIRKSLIKVDFNKLHLLGNNEVFLDEKDMMIDLGGIAKGYAADEAKKILLDRGVKSAIIDLGGNIYALGSKPDGTPWRLGIQNPMISRSRNKVSHIGIFDGKNISVVTSGDYERYFEENGIRYHHIIDSKTGFPARNNVAGISVLSQDSIDGDALSTALFVLGLDEGLKLAEKIDGVDVIYITKDMKIYISSNLRGKFEITNEEFEMMTP